MLQLNRNGVIPMDNKTNINWDIPTFVNYLQNTYK